MKSNKFRIFRNYQSYKILNILRVLQIIFIYAYSEVREHAYLHWKFLEIHYDKAELTAILSDLLT